MSAKLNSRSGICDVALTLAIVATVGWTMAILGWTKKSSDTTVYVVQPPATSAPATKNAVVTNTVVATNNVAVKTVVPVKPAVQVPQQVKTVPKAPAKEIDRNQDSTTVIQAASGRAADILATGRAK